MARAPKQKLRKDGKPFKSSTGRKRPKADQTNWRVQLQARRLKFDDDQKIAYCKRLTEAGRKGDAARFVDVSSMTVDKHYENDPDFAEMYDAALEAYAEGVSAEVVRRGQIGWEEPIFHKGARAMEPIINEDGTPELNEAGEQMFRYCSVTKFSDRLLELEAKRVDPGYREKQTVDLNATGTGVLFAPAGKTPEEELEEAERVNAEADAKREKDVREAASKRKK